LTKGAELVLVAGGINVLSTFSWSLPRSKHRTILRANEWRSAVLIAIGYFFADALRFYKLRPSQDVVIAQIGGLGERMVALTSGVVDAASSTSIKSTKRKVGYQVLIDCGIPLNYSTQGIVVSKDFLGTRGTP
jgi:hypothetical protein